MSVNAELFFETELCACMILVKISQDGLSLQQFKNKNNVQDNLEIKKKKDDKMKTKSAESSRHSKHIYGKAASPKQLGI